VRDTLEWMVCACSCRMHRLRAKAPAITKIGVSSDWGKDSISIDGIQRPNTSGKVIRKSQFPHLRIIHRRSCTSLGYTTLFLWQPTSFSTHIDRSEDGFPHPSRPCFESNYHSDFNCKRFRSYQPRIVPLPPVLSPVFSTVRYIHPIVSTLLTQT
jgi:hypothetical protein